MQESLKRKSIRRVVTGHDAQGLSVLVRDGASPFVLAPNGEHGPVVTDLWKSFGAPADNSGSAEPCANVTLAPPARGSVLRTVQFPPDGCYMNGWDEHAAFAAMGHDLSGMDTRKGATVGMHRTRSLDYAIVLSGEIWAVMDQGETLLRAGDVLVQRGTNHGWSNRSAEPALVAFVLIDAQPLAATA
ncbi:cupin domain-containing protein [Variovorax fucosicus]|uniref:cupin domain-containing protein n=1 Tax=Variovorax fucosicus TaxID=3053517 RepID=UPI0025769E6F|nr:cupin domain-containing protein [Variovorax sp. J22G47]MDM0058921.1 cupin domain-containing protein [Variovorax sp. J22G47]